MTEVARELLSASTTVIELGDSLAAAFCGRLLRQLGATVVRVEPPQGSPLESVAPFVETSTGEPVSATYLALNDGKEVVTADADTAEGLETIETLLRERGDIVLMSGPLQEWAERKLAPERIMELSSRAVIGRVTLFGDVGPYASSVGGELQAQALGGLMNMIGEPDAEPLRIGGYPAQYSTGLSLLTGVSLGLFRRERTNRGSSFSTSVIETVANMEWKTALTYRSEGKIAKRGWRHDPPLILRCRDGFFAFFYLPNDWPKVLEVVGDPRLLDDRFSTQENRNANRDELVEILSEFTGRFGKVELYHKTQAAKMTTGYMATMADLLVDGQYQSRQFFDDIEVPDVGLGQLPGAPWRWTETVVPAGAVSASTKQASEVSR
ncbi:CoA transferase [Rhodococcus koreensis]